MIHITDKHDCCGCEACVQICPQKCISFQEDEEGFRYPLAKTDACTDCGQCERVCPMKNQQETQGPLKVYAAKNECEEELIASSSGGVFIALARKVIAQGGVVFGARFDERWNVVHAYTETEQELKAFMGSKYVQSRIGSAFVDAQRFLQFGRQVLFTGTSCQIVGLKSFLRRDYDNLLAVDVICHGVPSPKVWRRYVLEICKTPIRAKYSVLFPFTSSVSKRDASVQMQTTKIRDISFRDKRLGWKKYSFAFTLAETAADGKQNTVSLSHIHRDDSYMKLFLKNLILRPSCYQCPAKNGRSGSDLTVGDFWKIETLHPEYDDERGLSLVIVNTEKGQRYMETCPLTIFQASYDDIQICNPVYGGPVKEPIGRQKCFRLMDSKKSMSEIVTIMFTPPLRVLLKRKIKSVVHNVLGI